MKRLTPEQSITICWAGLLCGIVGAIGLIAMIPIAKAFGQPFSRYFFPLLFAGDLYCTLFLAWRIRRMKKVSN
jgi:ABC-type antimicrobial peptide transport system permease subunit